jgi:hypothetical protein
MLLYNKQNLYIFLRNNDLRIVFVTDDVAYVYSNYN